MKSNPSSKNRAADVLGKLTDTGKNKRSKLLEKVKKPSPAEEKKQETQPDRYPYSSPYTEHDKNEEPVKTEAQSEEATAPPPPSPAMKEDAKPEVAATRTDSDEPFAPPDIPDGLTGREQRLKSVVVDMQEKGRFKEIILVDSSGLSLVSSSESSSRDTLAAVCVLAVEALKNSVKFIAKNSSFFAMIGLDKEEYLVIKEINRDGDYYYLAAISSYPTTFERFDEYIETIIFELTGSRAG